MLRNAGAVGETVPAFFGSLSRSICGEFSDAWPLMQNPICGDDISFRDSYPELTGEDIRSLHPEKESLDSNSGQDLVGGTAPIQAPSENFTETTGLFRHSSPTDAARTWGTQLGQPRGAVGLSTQTSLQVRRWPISLWSGMDCGGP